MKNLYVKGIVQDYDKSINSINKYLFNENERLNVIIDELEARIDKAVEYLKTFHFIDDIRVLDVKEYKKLLEILGDKE